MILNDPQRAPGRAQGSPRYKNKTNQARDGNRKSKQAVNNQIVGGWVVCVQLPMKLMKAKVKAKAKVKPKPK